MRLNLKLIIAVLTLIAPTASYASCRSSWSQQSLNRKVRESRINDLMKRPKESLDWVERSIIEEKMDYTPLDTAIATCETVENTRGVLDVWY